MCDSENCIFFIILNVISIHHLQMISLHKNKGQFCVSLNKDCHNWLQPPCYPVYISVITNGWIVLLTPDPEVHFIIQWHCASIVSVSWCISLKLDQFPVVRKASWN